MCPCRPQHPFELLQRRSSTTWHFWRDSSVTILVSNAPFRWYFSGLPGPRSTSSVHYGLWRNGSSSGPWVKSWPWVKLVLSSLVVGKEKLGPRTKNSIVKDIVCPPAQNGAVQPPDPNSFPRANLAHQPPQHGQPTNSRKKALGKADGEGQRKQENLSETSAKHTVLTLPWLDGFDPHAV